MGFALVLALGLGGIHWYLWIRLVRDASAPGSGYRRVGTVLAVTMPLLSLVSLSGERAGVPFEVLQIVSWPGFYWVAVMMYLVLALLVGEAVRPVLLRRLRRAAAGADRPAGGVAGSPPERGEGVAGDESDADVERRPSRAAGRPAAGAAASAGGGGGAPADAGSGVGTLAAAGGGDGGEAASEAADRQAASDGDGTASEADARAGGGTPDAPGEDAADAAELGRRRFVARLIGVGAGVVAAGTVGYGSYAARRLTTKHVTVSLARLPRAAQGYRIAVVSDVHLNAIMGGSHCRRVVDAVNRAQPDLITVVGDLVDGDVTDLRSAAAPLADLRARDGAFFVTGNHEYYVDTEEWIDHVRELGLTPLENARVELPHFDLAGVNDLQGEGTDHGGPDFEAALGDRDPRRTAVLMAHQPAQIHDAVDHGVDLQLSGHSHGGQLWPATYVAALANPTLAGLERYGDTQLYVSRGAGAWGPPVRVGADPDVTIITLESPHA